MTTDFRPTAQKLIEAGLTPVPLVGKKPVIDNWQILHDVTMDKVEKWHADGQLQNIGVLCGEASGNLVIIDFDGLPGYEAFIAAFPQAVNTLTVKTGSGDGMHVYYRVKQLPAPARILHIPWDGYAEGINIEFRSTGLQCVAPPSVHPDTHKPYVAAIRKPIAQVDSLGDMIEWARELDKGRKALASGNVETVEHEWQPPVIRVAKLDNINPRLLIELDGYFRRQPSARLHGDWINAPCPNTAMHKHGDRNPSFGYNMKNGLGHCFTCGTMLTKQICDYISVDPDTYGGLFEKREVRSTPSVKSDMNGPETDEPQLKVVERDNILGDYLDRVLDAPGTALLSSVIFPLRVLHKFGGTAVISRPGRLVGILGTSGGGKTSILETMIDAALQTGTSVLVWSPEWTPDEFVERAIQRYGGPNMADLLKHELYRKEREEGRAQPSGKLLSDEDGSKSAQIIRMLRGWQGKVAYLDEPLLDIEKFKRGMSGCLAGMSFKPEIFVLDYAQVLKAMSGGDDMSMYDLLMQVKQVCRANGLLGIIASQVTKTASKEREDGAYLTSQDGRFVNDDAFNLVFTINPEWRKEIRNGQAVNVADTSVLNVTKNSLGLKGKVRVGVDLSRLAFDDKEHSNQFFEEDK